MDTPASPDVWPTLRPTTLSDGVYSVLRERIRKRILPPGESIREADIGRALGVSRTPVREALGRLATEGLIERLPHRGFRVATLSADHLCELYPLISILDGLGVRMAVPRFESSDIQRLEVLNRELADALARRDVRGSIETDQLFHGHIIRRSGNASLISLLEDLRHRVLQGELSRFHVLTETDSTSCRVHYRFLDAARRGDAEAAARLLESDRFWTARALLCEGPVPPAPAVQVVERRMDRLTLQRT